MNRKQFILLLALVIVVGAAGYIIHQRGNQSWRSAESSLGGKLLPNFAINDVAHIRIQSGTNAVNLARSGDLWRVAERADYPANFSQISGLLLKLADLKIIQTEDVGPSQLGRFDLLPAGAETNSGTLVEFNDASGKTLDSLLLGKQHMRQPAANSQFGGEGWPDGRYVMVGTGAKTVDVISDPLDSIQPQPAQWLDKEFLSIAKPRTIAAEFPVATNSWKLTRASETNDWQLADAKPGEQLDTSKLYDVTSPFSSASFSDVAPFRDGGTSNTVLTVTTFDGFAYVATIGPKQDDHYPVTFKVSAKFPAERAAAKDEKPADKARLDKEFAEQRAKLAAKLAKEQQFEHWTYLLPSYSVDEILKHRSRLLVEAKKAGTSKAK